ncbi:uncharacterized protein METZ01_LOCUS487860, partial [marine metagenome]
VGRAGWGRLCSIGRCSPTSSPTGTWKTAIWSVRTRNEDGAPQRDRPMQLSGQGQPKWTGGIGMPLVLRDARLADSRRVDISVDDGRVVELTDAGCLADEGAEVHDLDGWLV